MRVFAAYSSDVQSAVAKKWEAGLPDEKCQRIRRYRHEEHRVLALTAHRLLCYALKNEYGFVPSKDDWAIGKLGKPFFKKADNIHFSISHSACAAICAVHERPVGVDIERIRPVDDSLAKRIMSEQEWHAYQQEEDKQGLFFKVWALKEAYLKYTGKGIIGALDAVTVYPEGDKIRTNVKECIFTLIDSVEGYQAAVCADTIAIGKTEWVESAALIDF